jgi:2-deoxy-D-gluconate 3-dehydrogenase
MGGILDAFKLDGKVAVVTGANRGIGRGIALGLAQAGADILGVSRDDSAPETRQLVEAAGSRYVHCAADLGDMDSLARVVPAAREAYGRIDILVNNAGIIRRNDSLDFSEQDWDQVMDVNLKATFFLSRDVARLFVEQGSGGKIINIASMLSFQGGIRVPSYTASKSGVKGLTMLLANEWAAKDINVNAIAPGYIATDNTQALQDDQVRSAEILGRIPAGRWGDPGDLAGAAVFLASAASDYMQGFTMAVDGGWLAR